MNEEPLTEEEIAQGEANARKPMSADILAMIERDIPRYADGKLDASTLFLHACSLLREVRRLNAEAAEAAEYASIAEGRHATIASDGKPR